MVEQQGDSLTEVRVSWTAPDGLVGGYRVRYTNNTSNGSETIDFVGETFAVITGENIALLVGSEEVRQDQWCGRMRDSAFVCRFLDSERFFWPALPHHLMSSFLKSMMLGVGGRGGGQRSPLVGSGICDGMQNVRGTDFSGEIWTM